MNEGVVMYNIMLMLKLMEMKLTEILVLIFEEGTSKSRIILIPFLGFRFRVRFRVRICIRTPPYSVCYRLLPPESSSATVLDFLVFGGLYGVSGEGICTYLYSVEERRIGLMIWRVPYITLLYRYVRTCCAD